MFWIVQGEHNKAFQQKFDRSPPALPLRSVAVKFC
jgi:hypothetical protein